MKQMFNHWSLVPAVAALIILTQTIGAFAQPVNVEAAKKEGKIVVYGSVVPQAMEGLHQAFKKKYGIDVEYWRGSSTQVSERALTEWRAGKPGFDIAEGNRGVQLIMKRRRLVPEVHPAGFGKISGAVQRKGRSDHSMARAADQHSLQHRDGEERRICRRPSTIC